MLSSTAWTEWMAVVPWRNGANVSLPVWRTFLAHEPANSPKAHPQALSPSSVHAKLETRPVSESPATSTVPGGRIESESGEDVWLGGLDRGTAGRNPLPQTEVRTPLSIDYHGTVGEQFESIVDETGAITVSLPSK